MGFNAKNGILFASCFVSAPSLSSDVEALRAFEIFDHVCIQQSNRTDAASAAQKFSPDGFENTNNGFLVRFRATAPPLSLVFLDSSSSNDRILCTLIVPGAKIIEMLGRLNDKYAWPRDSVAEGELTQKADRTYTGLNSPNSPYYVYKAGSNSTVRLFQNSVSSTYLTLESELIVSNR